MIRGEVLLFALALMATKGLGGSFNSIFKSLGMELWHGPFIGTVLMLLLLVLFGRTLRKSVNVTLNSTENIKTRTAFLVIFFCLLALSMILRVKAVLHTPIDVGRADMLPAVRAEIRTFLDGKNPYELIQNENGTPVLHGYPPMLWMGYLPFHLLGLDLRFWNLLAQFLFYVLALNYYLSRQKPFFSRSYLSDFFFVSVLGLSLFSKQEMKEAIDLHTASYWVFTALFFWSVLTDRKRLMLFSVPLLILCREPGILFVLPYCLYLFFQDRPLFWKGIFISLLVVAIVAGPFIWIDAELYFRGIFFYAHHIYENPASEMLKFYGWSGVLAQSGWLSVQKPIQLSGFVFALVYALVNRKTLSKEGALALGGISYLTLIMVASLTYQFLFVEVFHLAVFLSMSGRAIRSA